MIIDAHNHPDWHGHNFERYIGNMDRHHIDATWLLAWEAPRDEWDPVYYKFCPHPGAGGPVPFTRCLSYKERAPERFVLGYAVDPRLPEAIDLLEGAVAVYGVQVYGELKLRMCYDNPDALRMYRFCGERGLPVVMHLNYEFASANRYPRSSYWYGGGFDALARAVRMCPDTIFLGHAPGFWAHLSGDDKPEKEPYPRGPVEPGGKLPALMRECSNLWCDLSAGSGLNALKRDPEFSRMFLIEFQDRCIYGRDIFDNAHQDFIESIYLPADVKEKVYSGNALRLAPIKK